MARHNFLIQKHINGPDGSDANCTGQGAEWRDLGTGSYAGSRDAFGNIGFGTLEEARESLASHLSLYPTPPCRIIQIVS